MNLITSVFLFLLWSSYANSTEAPLQSSIPIKSKAFSVRENLPFVDKNFNFRIDNMPKIQSQDTVGDCFGCAAASVMQKYLCDNDSSIKKLNKKCSELPNNKIISQFSMVGWSDTNKPNQTAGLLANHGNIKLYSDTTEYSSGSNALKNSVQAMNFKPESCFPVDQLVNKYGIGEKNILFETIYLKIKALYEKNKKNSTEGEGECEECLKELNADFNTSFAPSAVSSALKKENFGEFLYDLIFKNCDSITFSSIPTFNQIPDGNNSALAKSKVFSKIKEIVDTKSPALITGLCLSYNDKNECNSRHTTIVDGYRKVCPSQDMESKNCKIQVHIQNCWGDDWQKRNDDGWFNSDTFIDHINYGSNEISEGAISWLE